MESLQTDEQYLESQRRIHLISQEVHEVRQITSCEWEKQKKSLLYQRIREGGLLPTHPESESQILQEIIRGSFYGVAKGRRSFLNNDFNNPFFD